MPKAEQTLAQTEMCHDSRQEQHKALEQLARSITCGELTKCAHGDLVFQLLDSIGSALITLDELNRENG